MSSTEYKISTWFFVFVMALSGLDTKIGLVESYEVVLSSVTNSFQWWLPELIQTRFGRDIGILHEQVSLIDWTYQTQNPFGQGQPHLIPGTPPLVLHLHR